jgi:DNA repair protein RadC
VAKKKSASTPAKGNGANLGFEQKLWAAADKMRGHMDAAEYKHVARVFHVAYLDSTYRRLRNGSETLGEGTKDRAPVYRRRGVEAVIGRTAAALAFVHNDPNGNVQPSGQDKVLTRAQVLAAETLHIKVLGQLIVSADKVLSFQSEELL